MQQGLPSIPSNIGATRHRASGDANVDGLYAAYCNWLSSIRHTLGKNNNLRTAGATKDALGKGIIITLENIPELDSGLFSALEGFSPGCRANSQKDYSNGVDRVRVGVPWPVAVPGAPVGYYGSPSLFWRFADNSRAVATAIFITCASAAYTTTWVQWRGLLAAVSGGGLTM